jgi:hypothetical protein
MDDKVLLVLNNIAKYPSEIGEIAKAGPEYYFKYKTRFLSVAYSAEKKAYMFFLYPRWNGNLVNLVRGMNNGDLDAEDYFAYSSTEGTHEPFREVFDLVKKRYTNIDSVLEDLLSPPSKSSDDDIPF